MKRILARIDVYKKQSSGSYKTTASFSLGNQEMIDHDMEITTTADKFQFTMSNPKGLYSYGGSQYFDVDDKVMIYITSTTTPSTPIFTGIITAIKHDIDNKKVTVEGVDLLEKFLNTLQLANYTDYEADDIIQNIIAGVADNMLPGQKITWYSGNSTIPDNGNYHINYYQRYMPSFQMIEELSRAEKNKYGDFTYYLDVNNEFHWTLNTTTPSSTTFTEGTDFIGLSAGKDVYDVVTALVVNVGNDPYGRAITAIDYNLTLTAEYGLRWGNTVEPIDRANMLIEIECKGCRVGGKWAGSYGPWTSNDSDSAPANKLPADADYTHDWGGGNTGFKVPWKSGGTHKIGSTIYSKGDTMYLTNNAAFVSEIRYEARRQGKEWIQGILKRTGIPRWKVDGKIQGSYWEQTKNNPTIGNLYTIYSETIGWLSTNAKALRLKHIGHTLDKKGWVVDCHWEEDPSIVSS